MTTSGTIEQLLEAFQLADIDKNNCVTKEELGNLMKRSGVTGVTVEYFMSKLDLNKDGKVDLEEFKQAIGAKPSPKADWRKLFLIADQDKSNCVSLEELKKTIENAKIDVDIKKLEEYFKTHDTDGNGNLDRQEFKGFVRSLAWFYK